MNDYTYIGSDNNHGPVFRRLDGSTSESEDLYVHRLADAMMIGESQVGSLFSATDIDDMEVISFPGQGFSLTNIVIDSQASAYYSIDYDAAADPADLGAGIFAFMYPDTGSGDSYINYPTTLLAVLHHDGAGNWYHPDHKILADLVTIRADIAAVEVGNTQPRVNYEPEFLVNLPDHGRRLAATPTIRIRAGSVPPLSIGINVAPRYGKRNRVTVVGTPVLSSGSTVTCTALGPRDEPSVGHQLAMIEIGGTASLNDEVSIDVPITLESGATPAVRVKLLAPFPEVGT